MYFAGGCFWGTEHFFKQIRGVKDTTTGYANGNVENPTYKQVCTDTTSFAETVKVEYDENEVSLQMLVELFFKTIDPTVLNRQGHDTGTQYRTGIYYTDEADGETVRTIVSRLAKNYDKPIVTEVEPLKCFYNAEDYHQDYLDNNPGGYCHLAPALFAMAREANRKD